MSKGFTDPSLEGLVPEFLPTDVRFFAVAPRKALAAIVGRLAAISAADSLVKGTDMIRIEPTGVNFLKFYASNGSIFMRSNLHDVQVRGDGDLVVPSKRLAEVLKLTTGDEVTLSCVGFELQVSSDNSMWRIQLPSHQAMPELPEGEGKTYPFQPAELSRILRGVQKAAADGFSRVSLTQVKLGSGYALGCDGARLHRIHSEALESVPPFTIPTLGVKLFLVLLKALKTDNEIALRVTNSSVTMITEDEEITILRALVAFPEVEQVYISQSILNDTTMTATKDDLIRAVSQVKVFADSVLGGVSITTSEKAGGKHVAFIHAKDETGNFSSTEISVTMSGKAVVDLKLNYKQLQEALEAIESDMVSVRVAKSSKSKKTSAYIEDVQNDFVAVLGQVMREN